MKHLSILSILFSLVSLTIGWAQTVPQSASAVWDSYQTKILADPVNPTFHQFAAYQGVVMFVVTYDLGTLTGTTTVGVPKSASPKITAYYAFPASANSGAKVPGIVEIHGGGQVPDWYSTWWWASQGYAVVNINWGGKDPLAS